MATKHGQYIALQREDGLYYVGFEPPRGYTQIISHGFKTLVEAEARARNLNKAGDEMTKREERETYENRLLTAGLNWAEIRGLHILANRMQRALELECSVEHFILCGRWFCSSDEQGASDWVEKGLTAWLKRVNARLEAGGHGAFEMETQGDPRGSVVKLRGRGLPCTSWGGDGWFCVWAEGLPEGCWAGLERASDARAEQLKRKAARKAEKEAGRLTA